MFNISEFAPSVIENKNKKEFEGPRAKKITSKTLYDADELPKDYGKSPE